MKLVKIIAPAIVAAAIVGCSSDADVAARNLSKAADQFEVERRIVFYNGITGEYMLEIVGRCALGNNEKYGQRSVTCKTGPGSYKRHFLGLSDNVTYFAEQIESAEASAYRYRVIFKPESVVPDVDLQTSF